MYHLRLGKNTHAPCTTSVVPGILYGLMDHVAVFRLKCYAAESVVELYRGRVDRVGKDDPRVNPFALEPTASNI